MNLRSVDLNLLVVLDALLMEAHVSRAAKQLNVSQPAVSAALERCRHLFKDALLERAQGGMRLTPRAETLRTPIRAILDMVSETLSPEPPDLSSMQRTVRVIMPDVLATSLAHDLLGRLNETAPLVDLVILPWSLAPAAMDALTKGTCDLAITSFPLSTDTIRKVPIHRQKFQVAMRTGHPAARNFDLDSWLSYPHVSVSGTGSARTGVDDQLATIGRERRVGLVLPSFAMVPAILRESDLIATLPTFCLPENPDEFEIFEPPVPMPEVTLHVGWEARSDQDTVVQHVKDLIGEAMKDPRYSSGNGIPGALPLLLA